MLLRRRHGEEPGAAEYGHRHRNHPCPGPEEQYHQRAEHQHLGGQNHPGRGIFVREPSPEQVAYAHSRAAEHHNQGHRRNREAGDLGHHRAHIAVVAENASVPGHSYGKDEPGFRLGEEGKLSLHALVGKCRKHWYPPENEEDGQRTPEGGEGENHPPAHRHAQERPKRHAEQVRHRHTHYHNGHRSRGVLLVSEPLGHYAAHAEKGPVRQARDEAGCQRHVVAGREGGYESTEQLYAYQAHEYGPKPASAGHQHRERRAHAYAQGINRNQVSGLGNGNGKVGGDVGKYSHHHIFGDTETEGAEGKGVQAPVQGIGSHILFYSCVCPNTATKPPRGRSGKLYSGPASLTRTVKPLPSGQSVTVIIC